MLLIDLFGDMARIHIRYFRNKQSYKNHIENISFTFANILDTLTLSNENDYKIALCLGNNLNKLASISGLSVFFEINLNMQENLIDSVKKVVCEQIIEQ